MVDHLYLFYRIHRQIHQTHCKSRHRSHRTSVRILLLNQIDYHCLDNLHSERCHISEGLH